MPEEESLGLSDENRNEEEIEALRDKLMLKLSSYESVIHYFQLLLVWERPLHSVVFVLLLHLVFWYLKVCSSHAIGLLSAILLLILWLDMWKHKIWPEIRARDPDPEADGWGELHPHVLTFPEICMVLATACINFQWYWRVARDCRKIAPRKFALSVSVACLLTAFVGRSISGTLLAYIALLCIILWPLMWYNRFLERTYFRIEPFLMQLQYSLKPRMRRTGKKVSHKANKLNDAQVEVITDSSSDDEEMSDFMQPLDAVTAEVLARALTDDEELSESDESLLANELPSLVIPNSTHSKGDIQQNPHKNQSA